MARRTAGRPSKTGATKKKAQATSKAAARKPAAKKTAPKKPTRKPVVTAAKTRVKTSAKKAVASRKPAPKQATAKKVAPRKAVAPNKAVAPKVSTPKRKTAPKKKVAARTRVSSIDSRRRELEDMVPSPPSSLNMVRRGSSVRTGRAERAEHKAEEAHFTPSINGGDEDVNVEDAYFTGDEAPGGDNSTPDQDIVDEIGRALGVEYQDNEELRGAGKLEDRDRHRWELDPASAEDYRDRD